MKVSKKSLMNTFDDLKGAEAYARETDRDIQDMTNAFAGRIRFGGPTIDSAARKGTNFFEDGDRGENMSGQFKILTTHATPGTQFSITHSIAAIPQGWIIMWQDGVGSLCARPDGTGTVTAWTAATNGSTDGLAYFESDVASTQFGIFLLK